MKREELVKGYILVIMSAFLFGCMPLITCYIYAEGINRESVVLMRNMLALPVLAIITLWKNRSFAIPVKAVPGISIIALSGCCITPLLLYGSYQYIATGTATVFHFVYPAVVVLIGLTILRKKSSGNVVCAVIICVIGIVLFYNPNEPLNVRGCVLALTSGVTYAIYIVLLSVFRYREVSGFKLSFYVSVVCTVVMLVVCLVGKRLTLPTTITGWLLCVLLALVINVGAVAMFQRGTVLVGGEHASVLSTVEPLTGLAVGVVVFRDNITVWGGVGAGLVLVACVWLSIADAKASKGKHEEVK